MHVYLQEYFKIVGHHKDQIHLTRNWYWLIELETHEAHLSVLWTSFSHYSVNMQISEFEGIYPVSVNVIMYMYVLYVLVVCLTLLL